MLFRVAAAAGQRAADCARPRRPVDLAGRPPSDSLRRAERRLGKAAGAGWLAHWLPATPGLWQPREGSLCCRRRCRSSHLRACMTAPRRLIRSGGRWHRSDVFSRFASDPCCGTHRSSVRSSPSCRPATLHGECRAPCSVAGLQLGLERTDEQCVPQVSELAAVSPTRRMMARCARGGGLKRRRRASQRLGSPR